MWSSYVVFLDGLLTWFSRDSVRSRSLKVIVYLPSNLTVYIKALSSTRFSQALFIILNTSPLGSTILPVWWHQ